MNINHKEALARVGDMGSVAAAIRLRAARKVVGLGLSKFAEAAGVSTTAMANAEAGLNFPSRDVLRYLYRAHRIDFNFMINGDFAQLPGDVQDRLFPALEAAASEWDRKEGSGRTPTESRHAQPND